MSAAAYENGPQLPAATLAREAPSTAVLVSPGHLKTASRAERMRQAKAELRSVPERTFVQAIDRWLDGGPWEGAAWFFTSGRGLVVRLTEDGDDLTDEGIPIVSRDPIRLCDLPKGTRTSRRSEARALAAVAVRGDAGWYDGEPRKLRVGAGLS